MSIVGFIIRFYQQPVEAAQQALAEVLQAALKNNKRVLWLVPGGSNIPVSVAVMNQLDSANTDKLAIMLTDERFGAVGHKDSNLRQLAEAGFDGKKASVVPVLHEGLDLQQTANLYANAAHTAFASATAIIGQFGMGADGHIAGIKPGSPAARAEQDWAVGYEWDDFTRLSLTAPAIVQIKIVFVLAYGQAKNQALNNLKSKKLSVIEQPAQILKKLKNVNIYNDQLGAKK
ncbi:MAG: 6-phosphogluconolactonase [Candidatus Saccharimonadales bacterium]